jgi:cytochrome o ubiquinol oxidase subunit 1
MVVAGAIGAFATFVAFAWRDHDEDVIPAREVERIDRNNAARRHPLAGSEAPA